MLPRSFAQGPLFQTVVPQQLRDTLLLQAHKGSSQAGQLCAHGVAMFSTLSVDVWWPSMRDDCLSFECEVCSRQKKSHQRVASAFHATVVGRPGESMSFDLVPMIKSNPNGPRGFALLIDKFTGFISTVPFSMEKPTAAEAVELFLQARGPLFLDIAELRVDQDTSLGAKEFAEAMRNLGIELKPVSSGHQQANYVERMVQYVKQVLRTTLDGLPTFLWSAALPEVTRMINAMPHESKGCSPIEILTGWAPKSAFAQLNSSQQVLSYFLARRQSLWNVVYDNMVQAAAAQATRYDALHDRPTFVVGDVVRLILQRQENEDGNFNLSPPKDPNPWVIDGVLSDGMVLIRAFENSRKVQRLVPTNQVERAVVEQFDPRSFAPDEEPAYVIQKLHDCRKIATDDWDFLVEWAGFNDKRTYTWIPQAELSKSAPDLLSRFKQLWSDSLAPHTSKSKAKRKSSVSGDKVKSRKAR